MISKMLVALSIVACLSFYCSSHAAELVGSGKITYVENGWNGEGLVIHHTRNGPAGCTAPLNDFGIDKNNAAYKELVAMALSAYTSNSDVEIIVDTGVCIFGARTKVISIRMMK